MVRGSGPDALILSGFGMSPWTYEQTAKVVGRRARVIIPDVLRMRGRWSPDRAVEAVVATLDDLGVEDTIVIGHSFGGALALSLAVRHRERANCVVFADSTGLARRWELAASAVPGSYLWRLATYRSAVGFFRAGGVHPIRVARAGMWAFFSQREEDKRRLRESDLPRHVLWAERDTLLSRSDGEDFARDINGGFTIVVDPHGQGPVDHDWLFRHPHLLEDHLDRLGFLPPPDPEATAHPLGRLG